jgi:cytochrome b
MVNQLNSSAQKHWVWDASVRLGHWLLAICFATAYATGESESWRLWHVYSGGGVLGIVCFRVLWGFIGTPHARFSSFMRSPKLVLLYFKSIIAGKPEHHAGHNPAGGWAILGLLGLSAISAVTGWLIYQGSPAHWLEKAHEIAANLTLLLICVHVFAVLLSSKLHQENLIKAMVLGYKDQGKGFRSHFTFKTTVTGIVLLLGLIGLAVWQVV